MQVSSRGEKKQKGDKEEIEKALLTYCSQLGDFEVRVCVCRGVCNLTGPHVARSCKHGWFLCTTPTKCCHSTSEDSRVKKKKKNNCTRH